MKHADQAIPLYMADGKATIHGHWQYRVYKYSFPTDPTPDLDAILKQEVRYTSYIRYHYWLQPL